MGTETKFAHEPSYCLGQPLLRSQVPLAPLTSWRVGGPAEWYAEPSNLEELQQLLIWADQMPITFLGAGSNLLISDTGVAGLVIATRHLRHSHFDPETGHITAGAGVPLPKLAWQAAKRGWTGLEWAVGIPGTIGGAVVMNAGAHKSCMRDVLVAAQVLNTDGTIVSLTREDLDYGYRSSILQRQPRMVVQATLQLSTRSTKTNTMELSTQHLHHRQTTQPYHLPSCGSVFRNPQNYSAGWLVEQSGLKGYRIGGAIVSEKHANFILNCGNATSADIWRLIRHVQTVVYDCWAIQLIPEVKVWGDFSGS